MNAERTHRIEIINKTRQKVPLKQIRETAEAIVPAGYSLSVAFLGAERMRGLNESYRKMTYAPSVLSFPLSDESGEVLLCPLLAGEEAEKAGVSRDDYLLYLFIHSVLHLQGHTHGSTMEEAERSLCMKHNIHIPAYEK